MKIGVFGGSFDPVHTGHLLLCQWVREEFQLDKVLLVPTYRSPFKDFFNASASHRMEMLRLAISDNPCFQVWDYEVKRKKESYTFHTITALKNLYPDDEIYLIMGSDSFHTFKRWKNYEDLYAMVHVLVVSRQEEVHIPEDLKHKVTLSKMPDFEMSSSTVRQRVREGLSVKYMVRDEVMDYIKREGLYEDQGD